MIYFGQVWWLASVIPATQEVKIGRNKFPGQPGQKVSETPSQQNKLGVMMGVCHLKSSLKQKGQEVRLK
jgi:hypothetical protein